MGGTNFSERALTTAPSATAQVFERVAQLRAQGVPLVSLAVGEPDFEPPLHVREAAKRALDTGPYGYTQVSGLPSLREAIAARSRERRGIVHAPDEVVVCAGAKHALFNLSAVLFEPGDEVILPTPCWVSYAEQVRLMGATPVLVPCGEDDGFLLTPRALERAITARTKALVLCTPSNPTGAIYGEAELHELARVLREHELWVIVDEIYAELCYEREAAPSLLRVAPDLRERVVVVDGVSKSYAMTGFRVGWLLAPRALARACENVQSQATTSIATVCQRAAEAALRGDQSVVARMRAAYAERRARLVSGIRAIEPLRCRMPEGAFYAFVDVRALLGRTIAGTALSSDTDVARALLDHAHVAVVPGSAFFGEGYLRLSYAVSPPDIDEALVRIARFVHALDRGERG